jgi:NADH dehydrogenase FAD-containing subunit
MLRSTGDRVVIVGGGIAGALLAKTLQNHADVVLIDPYVSSISIVLIIDIDP